jgi:hypothetical protein
MAIGGRGGIETMGIKEFEQGFRDGRAEASPETSLRNELFAEIIGLMQKHGFALQRGLTAEHASIDDVITRGRPWSEAEIEFAHADGRTITLNLNVPRSF